VPLRPRRILRKLLLGLLGAFLCLCLLEGLASFVFLALGLGRVSASVAEHSHTEYDPELGWVNKPGVSAPDLYAPGRHLHTNAQRFRALAATPTEIPEGRVRIVCSGDSFTLGYGVSDADCWPSQLGALDPRLATVNMGQGGYGIDQAYLWYERERTWLKHDVLVLAFVSEDFERVRRAVFMGRAKPRFHVEGAELVLDGTPVPRTAGVAAWVARTQQVFEKVALVRALRAVTQRLGLAKDVDRLDYPRTQAVVAAIFRRLRETHAQAGSVLVLAYLPMRLDSEKAWPGEWRTWAVAEAKRQGIPMLDLGAAFRGLSAEELDSIYIAPGEVEYLGAAGHYTPEGNARIARLIHDGLMALPEVARRLK